MNSGISIIFLDQAQKPVILTGTSFSVNQGTGRELIEQPPQLVTKKTWLGREVTKEISGEKEWETVSYPDKIAITGGAFVSGWDKSYQETHLVPNVTISQYKEAFLAAAKGEKSNGMVVLDLTPIQKQNAEQMPSIQPV